MGGYIILWAYDCMVYAYIYIVWVYECVVAYQFVQMHRHENNTHTLRKCTKSTHPTRRSALRYAHIHTHTRTHTHTHTHQVPLAALACTTLNSGS